MFDGEWKRIQSDSTEQLAKVLGVVTPSGVTNEIMLEMLSNYINADLTTHIDERVSSNTWLLKSVLGFAQKKVSIRYQVVLSAESKAKTSILTFQ